MLKKISLVDLKNGNSVVDVFSLALYKVSD